jgi:hypothetical protein
MSSRLLRCAQQHDWGTHTKIHGFIEAHHGVLNLVLSDDVVVDTRVGRGDNGLYLCSLFNIQGCPIHFAVGVVEHTSRGSRHF